MADFEEVKNIIPNIDDFEKEMRSYCTPVLCPNFKEPLLTEFGSGTFVRIDNHYGILTAGHVADIFIKKAFGFFHLPKGEMELVPFKIAEIIQLPAIEGWSSIDLAFIRLDSIEEVLGLGHKFYDMDAEKNEVLSIFPEKIENMKCCAFLATPSEGKKVISLPDKSIIEYPYAAFSLGSVKEGSYLTSPFYFSGPGFHKDIQELEFRLDEFKLEITAKDGMPKSHKGSSGASFWGAELVCKDDRYFYTRSKLLGVLVEQKNNNLIMRGGVSIYKTFLNFCSAYLKNGDLNSALKKASLNDS
jgi:hypothetical protein